MYLQLISQIYALRGEAISFQLSHIELQRKTVLGDHEWQDLE